MRGFIVGGGLSINRYIKNGFNFDCLDKEFVVGCNKAYKICNCDYLVFTDNYFLKNFKNEFILKSAEIFCPEDLEKVDKKFHLFQYQESDFILPTSFNKIPKKSNTGSVALCIAYLLNLNPIYLVGIDLIQEDFDNKKIHFHEDYSHYRTKRTNPKKCKYFKQDFVDIIRELKKNEFDIYTCCYNSGLKDHIDYVSLFDMGF